MSAISDDLGPLRVLIVDDNEDYADNLRQILAPRRGVDVTVAHTVAGALAALEESAPDILLLDLRLPDGHGRTILEWLAERGYDTLTVVLTGNVSVDSAVESVNAGAFGFLVKDMPVEAILSAFERAQERIHLGREKRRLEERLRHQEQLALVGQMAATLAHEIRNPLTGIGHALEVLLDAVEAPAELRQLERSIRERFRDLEDLVTEVLDFSRPLVVESSPIDVRATIEAVRDEVARSGGPEGVAIKIEVAADIGPVRADRRQLEIALRNLVRNAAEAVRDARTREVRLRARRRDDAVEFEVEDSGAGVPEDQFDRIFEAFYTTRTRGTGLGLALVSRIAEAHRGACSVRNVPGAGACFTLRIPDVTASFQEAVS